MIATEIKLIDANTALAMMDQMMGATEVKLITADETLAKMDAMIGDDEPTPDPVATAATRKAWFVRKAQHGFVAIVKDLDTGAESGPFGPWTRTVEAMRNYIAKDWQDGTAFPEDVHGFNGPDPIIASHCLADAC